MIQHPQAPLGSSLYNYSFEVSYGSLWVDLNDGERYRIHAESGAQRPKTFRQIKTSSPIIEGDQLVHAVADMITETVKVMVYGQDQSDMEDNMAFLESLFEQFSYTVRVTKNDHREYWDCQMTPSILSETQHVHLHAMMGIVTVQVPRQPRLRRERVT